MLDVGILEMKLDVQRKLWLPHADLARVASILVVSVSREVYFSMSKKCEYGLASQARISHQGHRITKGETDTSLHTD